MPRAVTSDDEIGWVDAGVWPLTSVGHLLLHQDFLLLLSRDLHWPSCVGLRSLCHSVMTVLALVYQMIMGVDTASTAEATCVLLWDLAWCCLISNRILVYLRSRRSTLRGQPLLRELLWILPESLVRICSKRLKIVRLSSTPWCTKVNPLLVSLLAIVSHNHCNIIAWSSSPSASLIDFNDLVWWNHTLELVEISHLAVKLVATLKTCCCLLGQFHVLLVRCMPCRIFSIGLWSFQLLIVCHSRCLHDLIYELVGAF